MSTVISHDLLERARTLLTSAEPGRAGPEFLRRKLDLNHTQAKAIWTAIKADPDCRADERATPVRPAVSTPAPTGTAPSAGVTATRMESPPASERANPESRRVRLEEIAIEADVQPRFELDPEAVTRYAELLEAGYEFPPISLFQIAGILVLADGFHRVQAHKNTSRDSIHALVFSGTLKDAHVHALRSNAQHGLPLTPKEKRAAALRLLADPTWSEWSNREIARHCGLSGMTIGRMREHLHPNNVKSTRKCRDRRGGTRTMNVGRLGRPRRQPLPAQTNSTPTAASPNSSATANKPALGREPATPERPVPKTNPLATLEDSVDAVLRSSRNATELAAYPVDTLLAKLLRITAMLAAANEAMARCAA